MGDSILHTTVPREALPSPQNALAAHAPAARSMSSPKKTHDNKAPPPEFAMWTRGEDKLLELLHLRYFPRWRWEVIAARLPGNKTPEQVSRRYERVVDEATRLLQAPEVETPREWDAQVLVAAPPPVREAAATAAVDLTVAGEETPAAVEAETKALAPLTSSAAKKTKRKDKRKKPEKWTEEEHNLFLEGLAKYGKGRWKTMSTEYLTTKTANQIASHHQKHLIRLEQRKRNGCKRASIHDITEPRSAAGGEPAAHKDERGTDEGGGGDFVAAVEEFPGEDDVGTLFL